MDRNEIMKQEANDETNALIAVEVMRFEPQVLNVDTKCAECGNSMRFCGARSWCGECHEWRYSPWRDYSADIAAAWQVVEKMNEQNALYKIISKPGGGYSAQVWRIDYEEPIVVFADTAPLAICRAALLAVCGG